MGGYSLKGLPMTNTAPNFEVPNLNNDRYYLEGVTQFPDGRVIEWADWKKYPSMGPAGLGYKIKVTLIWDNAKRIMIQDSL